MNPKSKTTRRAVHRARAAAAVLGAALAGAAAAQSSVTITGAADVAMRHITNDGPGSRTTLGTDGRQNSRLVFRGSEDLGGGHFAEFHLEGQLSQDNGNANGFNWRRRSTVSLRHATWGELRLGRDLTPTFLGLAAFDPFLHNGVGLISNVDPFGLAIATFVRADNAVAYHLPAGLAGFYGNAMVAAGEGTPSARYEGARLGYVSGKLDLRASLGQQRINQGAANEGRFKTWTTGARYDFGVATLNLNYVHEHLSVPIGGQPVGSFRHWMVGAVVPFGTSEFKASYNAGRRNAGNGARQAAVGYVYYLSKRTQLYTNYARLNNEGNFAQSVDGGLPSGQTPVRAGGSSRALEAGITHNF